MANQISVNVYQFNTQPAIPTGSVNKLSFPSAGIQIRTINGSTGTVLESGVTVYSTIQLIATGSQAYVVETQAALVTLCNT